MKHTPSIHFSLAFIVAPEGDNGRDGKFWLNADACVNKKSNLGSWRLAAVHPRVARRASQKVREVSG
ncbi:hypothetical protein, partial [Rivihabitans pingtungensis]|uniref:hypothetical protein n=1 Tax=Rivihabitans pingtungensis TaxID=1054498 RepID=UPI002C124E8A